MAQVGDHSNLVSLIGVCTKGEPILMLVAFCEHGNLLDFLKKDQRAAAAATTKLDTFLKSPALKLALVAKGSP